MNRGDRVKAYDLHDIIFSQYSDFQTRSDVFETCRKMEMHFRDHERILISVSGGSDSDCIVHLVCKYFPEYVEKCHFVFVDTGLEYEATRRHIDDLKERYGIEIQKIRGMSVVTAVRRYGVPILSKMKSHFIAIYQRGGKSGIKYIFGDGFKSDRLKFTEGQKQLAAYVKNSGIPISAKCCDYSKKTPLMKFLEDHDIDLDVTGERKAEGGQRSNAHKSCFECHSDGLHKFMPLFWWSNATKADFKEFERIRYSDCYEVYGMKRTGCCGCPFNLDIARDLQAMYEYEPNLYKACMNVFGLAYELTDQFNCRRKKCLPDSIQLTLEGEVRKNG